MSALAPALLLALALSAAQEDGDPAAAERALWIELAARCGDELAWASDWDSAAERARAEKKPVLAVAWLYPGFDIPDATRTVFAMDPDVIELVGERCVPLRLAHDTQVPFASHDVYGLSPTSFGAALLLVAPDGRVLADTPHWQPNVAYDFLSRALAAHPELPGAAVPRGLDRAERAARHLARGELDEADGLLRDPPDAAGLLLRARLLRRRLEVDAALEAVARARERGDETLQLELDHEQAQLELARGHVGVARALCERIVSAAPEREEAEAARYALGALDFFAGERDGATRRWRELAAERPDGRWASAAAAALLQPEIQLSDFGLERWSRELLASVREVPPAARPARGRAGLDGALDWLARARRADGSWADPSELEAGASARNSISVAVDALATRALLAQRARALVDLAEEARLAVAASRRSLAARSDAPTYMTYEVWSDALALELLADLLAAGAGDAAELRSLGAELARALAARQRANGGWSYLESSSVEPGTPRYEQSISFVTASVVLALLRAHESGVELDPATIEGGLDALEAMRGEGGAFAYMLWSFQPRAPEEEKLSGAAGRGPLCELALLRGGRSDGKRLRAALAAFFHRSATLAREAGKALMHCGLEGEGSHYVLYDYACAARAITALPKEERAAFRERLRALVDATRREDGAYLDTPILGPASGTALAVLALTELER